MRLHLTAVNFSVVRRDVLESQQGSRSQAPVAHKGLFGRRVVSKGKCGAAGRSFPLLCCVVIATPSTRLEAASSTLHHTCSSITAEAIPNITSTTPRGQTARKQKPLRIHLAPTLSDPKIDSRVSKYIFRVDKLSKMASSRKYAALPDLVSPSFTDAQQTTLSLTTPQSRIPRQIFTKHQNLLTTIPQFR